MMNVLAVGDVVGTCGVDMLANHLPALRKLKGVDFCIVNGENAAGTGITPAMAEKIFAAGVEVITLGNHAFNRREIAPYLDEKNSIIRPANLGGRLPGEGFGVYSCPKGDVCVINLLGRVALESTANNPFDWADQILASLPAHVKTIFLDFHAEATSEKAAMAYHLAGRVSGIFGTHTHVQTADERIIGGTGFLTDLGMCGPRNSVIGIQPEIAVERFRGFFPRRFEPADGSGQMDFALFAVDANGRCTDIEQGTITD